LSGPGDRRMWPLASLAWALLGPVVAAGLSPQENSLLKSLGLSSKPSPRTPSPVPPLLWRMFRRGSKELDACRVEEFNVPGNIVRVFADQGAAPRRSGLSGLPGVGSGLRSCRIPGEIPAAWSP
ncbi:GDF3 factor, partial [Pardalotus punctatus]|nr:GDF3 factor [Pardalotus punctatus]